MVDCVATAASNPNPGSSAYLASLLVAPVLLSVAWSLALCAIVWLVTALAGRAERAHAWALRAVAAAWLIGVLADAVRSGHGASALCLTLLGAAVLATGLVAASTSAEAGLRGLRSPQRRALLLVALAAGLLVCWPILTSARVAYSPPQPGCELRVAGGRRLPNVVLLSVDTLRSDAARSMRAYQRLARGGFEFES